MINKTNTMNTPNKMKWMTLITVIVVTILPSIAMAQTDPGCGPDCPIDGGLSLLLAAGVGYGVKRYRNGKKKEVKL